MATPLSNKLDWEAANPLWAAALNPVLANPLNTATSLNNVSLVVGPNIINHKLGRTLQGWFVTDIQGVASIYRSAPFNSTTLTLVSDAAVTVNLGVF